VRQASSAIAWGMGLSLERAVASYLPARSAKGRAFHRFCIGIEADALGYGCDDPEMRQQIAHLRSV
jgi:hypothetical protein